MRLRNRDRNTARGSQAPARPGRGDGGVPSIISPEMTITGNVVSNGDVQVDGTVDGDVRAEILTIGEKGTINGTVRAATLRVLGHIDGEIQAGDVTILANARVRGDVVHESLAIEAGAMIEGHCRRHAHAEAEEAAAPAQAVLNAPANGETDDAWTTGDGAYAHAR